MSDAIANEFVKQARSELQESVEKIEHCLKQLPDIELWWRPFESANSIENILLHLCGNRFDPGQLVLFFKNKRSWKIT